MTTKILAMNTALYNIEHYMKELLLVSRASWVAANGDASIAYARSTLEKTVILKEQYLSKAWSAWSEIHEQITKHEARVLTQHTGLSTLVQSARALEDLMIREPDLTVEEAIEVLRKDEAIPEPTPRPIASVPVPLAVAAPEPVAVAAPVPEPAPVAVPVPEPAPVAVPVPEPAPMAVPVPEPAPVAVPVPEPAPVAVPVPEPKPRTKLNYNHRFWPSPRPRMFAKKLGANVRGHEDSLKFLAEKAGITVDALLQMSPLLYEDKYMWPKVVHLGTNELNALYRDLDPQVTIRRKRFRWPLW